MSRSRPRMSITETVPATPRIAVLPSGSAANARTSRLTSVEIDEPRDGKPPNFESVPSTVNARSPAEATAGNTAIRTSNTPTSGTTYREPPRLKRVAQGGFVTTAQQSPTPDACRTYATVKPVRSTEAGGRRVLQYVTNRGGGADRVIEALSRRDVGARWVLGRVEH